MLLPEIRWSYLPGFEEKKWKNVSIAIVTTRPFSLSCKLFAARPFSLPCKLFAG
jgi:hypothetical protein